MRELKDQLCTLLITFSDWDDPDKEITTAHTFASTDPGHYPQHRRVVHSRQAEDNDEGSGALLRRSDHIERVSQSALCVPLGINLGSDMVEHRRVLSSPAMADAEASSPPPSAGRLFHSPPDEKPREEPNDRLGGQLRHSNTSGSSPTSPPRTNSLINIHEVSLTYTRPSDHSQSTAAAAPNNRRSLPIYYSDADFAPHNQTTFPASGSVQMHFSEGKQGDGRLLYTVERPGADWTFGGGEVVQISDSGVRLEPHRGGVAMGMKPPHRRETTISQQQQPPRGKSTTPAATEFNKQLLEEIGRRGMRGSGGGRSPPMVGSPPPLPPSAQPPPSPPQQSQRPIRSHHQTRSFESSEESKMREQKGKGKSRTVFEKTTCELLTEKSVTTFGSSKQTPRPTMAPPPTATQQQQAVQHHFQPIRIQQQSRPRGLPRLRPEEMEVHLYTRYDDETARKRHHGKENGGGIPTREGPPPGKRREHQTRLVEEHTLVEEELLRRSWKGPATARSGTTSPEAIIAAASPLVVAPIQDKQPQPQRQQPPPPSLTRLIDFDTYKREVEQLQREAAFLGGGAVKERGDASWFMPLAPALVVGPQSPRKGELLLPKAMEPTVETTLKYFASDEMQETRKKRKKTELQRNDGEEQRRRKEQRERQRAEEERRRRMEAEWLTEVRRRREEADRAEQERKRLDREARMRMEEQRKWRAEAEKRAMRDKEEEARRKKMISEEAEATATRPAPIRQKIASSSETLHTVEVITRRRFASPPVGPKVPEAVPAEVRPLSAPPPAMVERALPPEGRTEYPQSPLAEMEARKDLSPETEKQQQQQQQQKMPEEPAPDYAMDTGRDIGKHLFETLRRELQYEEEVDTEIRRRRRKGMEEPEEGEETVVVAREEESEKPEETTEEEEPELAMRGMVDTEEHSRWWGRQPSEPSTAATAFAPIHRPGTKVSVSGELSLPPVKEEEEDTTEPSFHEKVIEQTIISGGVPAGSRKQRPPPPPPKPTHTLFGSRVTTPSEPPRYRDSSFSSAFSYFQPPTPTSHTYTMEYSPASSDYRSAISSRQHFSRPRPLSPARYSTDGGPRGVLKMVSETSSISSRPMSPFPGGSIAASAIRDAREREKKEMSELNDRLASYIEKVRFLEAQNRKLAVDLDFLRKRWGKDASNVREMFETDLRQARKVMEDTERQRDELERKARAMADEMAALKQKNDEALRAHEADKSLMEELLLKLAALEAELAALRRRLSILEDDLKPLKRENQRLGGEVQKARTDLDQETLNRIDYQNQVQTLLEEIDFLRRAHDSEIQDLQAMASRDTTGENREYFRNELSSAIREIRNDYDALNSRNRNDIESWYKLKVQEIQTQSTRQSMEQNYAKEEVRRLRTQLGDLRGKLADLEGRNSLLEKQAEELAYQVDDDQRAYEAAVNDKDAQIRKIRDEAQALMVELQMLMDTKQTLDAEIAIYRRMLEGEEDRGGLHQLVEQVVRTHGLRQQDETESQRVLRGEKSSRQSYQRSAKGNVSILEISPEGKYVVLENTHRSKEEPIGEWKLKRRIDGKREIVYTFPRGFVLRPGKSIKVWARGQGVESPPDQLVFDAEDSFGMGSNVQTILYNREGEERASLIQRSSGR